MVFSTTALAQAQAQDAPGGLDAGFFQERLQQELERRQERQREGQRPSDEPVITGADPSGEGGLPETDDYFVLEAIDFGESAFINDDRLQRIADVYTGSLVNFAALNRMIGWINAIYAREGIVTGRAMIPPQRIEDGVLRVQLVEGRLGQVEMQGQRHMRESFIRNRLAPMERGEVVDVIALRESIAWLNRTEDFRVGASLRAGQGPGETDVLLQVQEPPRYTVQLFADNHGSENTGEYRAGANLGMFSPLGFGDSLSVLLLGAEGSENISVGYQFPVNRRGGKLELRHTEGGIDIIEGPFQDLDVEGDSRATAITFDQPLLRTETLWRDLSLRASRSESDTTIEGQPLSEFATDRAAAALRFTGFGAQSQWTIRPGAEFAQLEDVQGETSSYWFLEGAGSFNAITFGETLITLRGAWQWTRDDAVPSPLLFQVGGSNSVRGYAEGVLAGARGYYVNAESRYLGFERVAPFAFIDHGHVNDVSPDSESVFSIGAGLGWEGPRWLSAEITVGVPTRDIDAEQDSYRINATLSASWSGG